jgi:hypothetical protein
VESVGIVGKMQVKRYRVGLGNELDRLRKLIGFLMICNATQLVYDEKFPIDEYAKLK